MTNPPELRADSNGADQGAVVFPLAAPATIDRLEVACAIAEAQELAECVATLRTFLACDAWRGASLMAGHASVRADELAGRLTRIADRAYAALESRLPS